MTPIDEKQANLEPIRITDNPPVRTQFLIFTLFGEYILDRGSGIWTSSLLTLMELLDVSPRAVRSALSRMRRKGWITPLRYGRMSEYHLTERGQALLKRGQLRIFENIVTDWDQQWHLVIYSLSEEKRKLRQTLRTQLAWLGFGQLAPGTWLSPHDRSDELNALVEELGAQQFVDMFSGVYLGPTEVQNLIARSWDLKSLESQYVDFISKYELGFKKLSVQSMNGAKEIDPKECFVQRFWLTHDFQSFPMTDPNLPVALLPEDWVGTTARQLFDDYHQLLGQYANAFLEEVLAEPNTK